MSSKDFGFPYSHVVGDTQVKPGKGILRRITVNGLTTAGDATIYDSLTEDERAEMEVARLQFLKSVKEDV